MKCQASLGITLIIASLSMFICSAQSAMARSIKGLMRKRQNHCLRHPLPFKGIELAVLIHEYAITIRGKDLPHAGTKRLRLYHEKTLDRWLQGDLAIPFDLEEPPKAPRRIRTKLQRMREGDETGFTNPKTGRFYPC